MVTMGGAVCTDVRIALGGVAPKPIRARKAEDVLKGSCLEDAVVDEAARVAADETEPITDERSVKEYRKEMTRILTTRAIRRSVQRVLEDR
jgi:carbon-monoxide dehydrogenase medium subunit